MKRAIRLFLVVVFVLSCTAPLFAALPEPVEKIKKGGMDILSIPYNLGKTTYDEMKAAEFKPFGLIGGIAKGTAEGVITVGTVAVDIVTLPFHLGK